MKTTMKKFVEQFRKHVIYFKLESSVWLRLTKSWLEGGDFKPLFSKTTRFGTSVYKKKDF